MHFHHAFYFLSLYQLFDFHKFFNFYNLIRKIITDVSNQYGLNINITNKYKKEDRINLHFKVITVKQYKGITFESIDFFKDSSNGINKQGPYPCISDYLK